MAVEMRAALCKALLEEMKKNGDIVTVGADLNRGVGFPAICGEFPERFINAGIAEQNMAGMAAGMAAYGMIPVINTFAPFATRRICDQIGVSICYAGNNVKILGLDPGISIDLNGGTHMSFEDIGVVRSIPGITVLEPADVIEIDQMTRAMLYHNGPVYMRFYRKLIPDIHTEDYKYELGKADFLKHGKDITIIAAGIMVHEAVEAVKELYEKGIEAEVINLHTIKPIDEESIINSAKKTGVIVTAENHNILGGLRASVAEVVTKHYPVKIYPVGVNDIKGEVGEISYLRDRFGLNASDIVSTSLMAVNSR